LANESGDETTQNHCKRKHRKNRKSGRSKRMANAFKRGGYYNMLEKFLEDEPGISMDDRSTKVVTYTCNTKETIPVEFNLSRKSNDVLGLSEWNKRTINFLNSHEKTLEIFSNQGSINFPVKMNAKIFEAFLMEFNFPEDHEFTRQELRQFHHLCRLRNLDMTPSNNNIWQSNLFLFHYLGKVLECNPNSSIQIQALDLNDVQGALQLISNYYHEWQGPEIYSKALENETIQIHPGWTILDLMEVIQLAKKEAKVVGRPIETQLLKYLYLQGVYATHAKYWEDFNVWLNDKNTLYQELVLRKHEVDSEQKFKGQTPTNNNLAIQLYAKIHSRNNSKSDVMMAITCSNEANIAHVANYGDLCRHVLCRGKRNSAKHL
jgi:hypothetical protein